MASLGDVVRDLAPGRLAGLDEVVALLAIVKRRTINDLLHEERIETSNVVNVSNVPNLHTQH